MYSATLKLLCCYIVPFKTGMRYMQAACLEDGEVALLGAYRMPASMQHTGFQIHAGVQTGCQMLQRCINLAGALLGVAYHDYHTAVSQHELMCSTAVVQRAVSTTATAQHHTYSTAVVQWTVSTTATAQQHILPGSAAIGFQQAISTTATAQNHVQHEKHKVSSG
jgi:hypothetical protein